MSTYGIRVRRGEMEVEVHGSSEEWVRDMLTELIEEHFPGAPGAPVAAGTAGALEGAGNLTEDTTFREILTLAPSTSAAEKVLLAGYLLLQRGQGTFAREDVARLLEEAMERQVNFAREVKAAGQHGWLARATGENHRYRLVRGGLEHASKLVRTEENET